MRVSSFTLGASAAAMALIAAQPAFATQSQAEFTGTASIVDTTGFFGTPGATFTSPFDLVFFVNDAGAVIQNSAPGFTNVLGFQSHGLQQGVQSDIEFGNLGGFSAGYDYGPPEGDANGVVARGLADPSLGLGTGGVVEYGADTTLNTDAAYFEFNVQLLIFSPSNFGQVGVDYNHPFTYAFGPDDQVFQADGRYEIDAFTPQALPALMTFTLAFDTLTVTSDEVAAVPEPDAWALMIAGFGGIGAALRRRGGQRARVFVQ